MPITLIKHPDRVEIFDAEAPLPLEVPILLYTADELAIRMGYRPEELLQLQAIAAEDDDDWGSELDALAADPS
jgi:hypothetical protein